MDSRNTSELPIWCRLGPTRCSIQANRKGIVDHFTPRQLYCEVRLYNLAIFVRDEEATFGARICRPVIFEIALLDPLMRSGGLQHNCIRNLERGACYRDLRLIRVT